MTVLAPKSPAEVQKEIDAIRKVSEKILASKKASREFLIKGGFITKSGKLTKAYSR